MGTNIFLIPEIGPIRKYKMIEAVMEEDWNELREIIPERVHIGKFSAGWMFLFNYNNGEYYEKTHESIDEFLQSGQIINEYGVEMTADEFWDSVLDFADGLWQGTAPKQFTGIGYEEEIIDGLRWTSIEEFS